VTARRADQREPSGKSRPSAGTSDARGRIGTRRASATRRALRFLRPELFFPDADVTTKEELLGVLVGGLADLGVAQHREALLDALLERERLGSTVIAPGIALPHARSMMVREAAVAFARPRTAIDFAAPAGGELVRVTFLLVSPYGATGAIYLPLVAALARSLGDAAIRQRLLELETFDQLLATVGPALDAIEQEKR
jgi:mannitol/fructose-specific phosphotransferase system IIA component (Ntr-type)